MNAPQFVPFESPGRVKQIFVALNVWRRIEDSDPPLVSGPLCNEAEVNAEFDRLEQELAQARAAALTAVSAFR